MKRKKGNYINDKGTEEEEEEELEEEIEFF